MASSPVPTAAVSDPPSESPASSPVPTTLNSLVPTHCGVDGHKPPSGNCGKGGGSEGGGEDSSAPTAAVSDPPSASPVSN
eukprot:Nitzschia sp. Nitz4//scaffold2_size372955//134795//135052//NITZ4_000400-RA/size372955-exonerate_est2genome-gene-0.574-mRNA-1//1//CDS//3329546707//9352//frame0